MTMIWRRLGSREAFWLACGIWAFHALLEMSIVGQFLVLPLIWASHGLILMLIMGGLLQPVLRSPSHLLRLAACVFLTVVFALLQTIADLAVTLSIGDALLSGIAPPPGMVFNSNNVEFQIATKLNFKYYIWLFGFYAAFVAMLAAIGDEWRARLAAQEARIEALRLQVAPHFLFNALNSLSALVATGRRDDAEAMIGRLSDFYRSSLLAADGDQAPLEEELDAIDDYLQIEQVRFGDRLRVRLDVAEDAAGALVPRLILQPLVENAMKHGVARTSAPVEVRVMAATDGGRLVLAVANDRAPGEATPPLPGTGSGLANIRRRLAVLYGRDAELTASGTDDEWRAVVTLPLKRDGEGQDG